jgi:hypothetical protein
VNGVTGSAANIINSNALGITNGALTSTVNGVASSSVNVLAAANNGLTATNGTVQLGGTLSASTTIATAGNALNITGLTAGASTDSLVTINTTTGKLNRISPSSLSTILFSINANTASNGLSLVGNDIRMGGSLSGATTITTTSSNTLAIAGLQSGAFTDSIVVANPSTGVLKRISPSTFLRSDSTTASNGLNLSGNDVQLGGSLTSATALTTSSTNTLAVLGLQTGASTDSLLVIGTGSVIKKVAAPTFPQLLVDARKTTTYTPGSSFATIVYNSAPTYNTGYSTTTGTFTAPATGLYEIIISNSYSLSNSSSNLNLQIGNQIIVAGSVDMEKYNSTYHTSTSGSVNSTVSGSTIVNMTSGQTATISCGGVLSNTAATPQISTGQHVLKIIRLQ